MTITLKKVGFWFVLAALAAFMGITMMPATSQAAGTTGGIQSDSLETFNKSANLGDQELETTIGSIVQTVLGFLGLLAVLIVLWAGFLWMTAGGNEDQIAKAKSILIAGLIGLLIILSAYAITTFVLREFGDATNTKFEGLE